MTDRQELAPGADRELAAWVDAHMDAMVDDLVRMLRIASVKAPQAPDAPFGLPVKEAIDLFLARAREEGFATEVIPGVAGHVEWGPADAPIVGVLAHLDVVPAGAGWTHDPFGAEREGDRLYARGAMDDKGPAIAALWALMAARARYGEGRRRVRLIIGGDEESYFECMHRYFARYEMPELGFTPDAGFPVVTAEKGIVTFVLSAPLRAAAAGDVRVTALDGGTRPNVVAAEARARLRVPSGLRAAIGEALRAVRGPEGTHLTVDDTGADELEVRAVGRGAHASLPELGANAATLLLRALARIEGLTPEDRAVLGHLAESGAGLDGAVLGVASADGESGALTNNLGTVALDGGKVVAQYNLRYPVTETLQALLARARDSASPFGIAVEADGHHAPLRADASWEVVASLDRVFEAETGERTRHVAIGGGTYARELPQGVAFGPQWPQDEERAHGADEFLSLGRLRRMVAIYARAIAVLSQAAPLP